MLPNKTSPITVHSRLTEPSGTQVSKANQTTDQKRPDQAAGAGEGEGAGDGEGDGEADCVEVDATVVAACLMSVKYNKVENSSSNNNKCGQRAAAGRVKGTPERERWRERERER